jgi:flagellar basal-body rod modification protein FlgD
MPVSSLDSTSGAGSAGAVSGALSDNLHGQEFLQLLVTQLRNQDPLNPVNDREFMAQMAQLSTLEATTELGKQVRQMVANQQQLGALQLVGRKIQYLDSGAAAEGTVTGVRLDGEAPSLLLGDREVALNAVQRVL